MLSGRDEAFCYLTTTGRRSGRPHTIEIWFAARDSTVFMLSGGRDSSDWVRNLKIDPVVQVRVLEATRTGRARVLEDGTEQDLEARRMLVEKYEAGEGGPGSLDDWGRTSLAIAIDLD